MRGEKSKQRELKRVFFEKAEQKRNKRKGDLLNINQLSLL